ncbi:MAG TPA: GWxTD domain-containing protein [Pontibacter sp.]
MARNAVMSGLLVAGIVLMTACGQSVPTIPQQAGAPVKQTERARAEVTMQYTYRASADSLHLYFLFFDVSRLMELQRSATSLTYEIAANGSTPAFRDTVDIIALPQPESGEDGIYVQVNIPREQVTDKGVMQLKLWQKFAGEARMHSVFRVPLSSAMLSKKAMLRVYRNNLPLVRHFTTTSDSLVLVSPDTVSAMLAYRFKPEFTPALPPMSVRQEAQPRALKPQDSLMVTQGKPFVLEQEGLYLLWPKEAYARGLLAAPGHFPQVTMAKEMVEPLIYLTTSAERQQLYQAKDAKKTVDDFWLSVAGEKHLARELIRTYYGRVEHANRLYTSHKPGWTTDRGMIYLVYGPPSDISRTNNNETWIYRQTDSQPYIKFVFTKKQNNFTENHYELVRRREYEESWYSAVAKWRAGITDM